MVLGFSGATHTDDGRQSNAVLVTCPPRYEKTGSIAYTWYAGGQTRAKIGDAEQRDVEP